MILYTPMPLETVLEGLEDHNSKFSKMKEVNYGGVTMLVTPENDMYKIQRLISTDPYDYINPDYQPGNLIRI